MSDLRPRWNEDRRGVRVHADPDHEPPSDGPVELRPRTDHGKATLMDPYFAPPGTPFYDRLRERIVAIEDEAEAAHPATDSATNLTIRRLIADLDDCRRQRDAIAEDEQAAFEELVAHPATEGLERAMALIEPAHREERGYPGNRTWADVDEAWEILLGLSSPKGQDR